MLVKDLKGLLCNKHGEVFQSTLLWHWTTNENGREEIVDYYYGIHDAMIEKYGDKQVLRIQADIIENQPAIVIQTN